jgi:hypothetical protein
MGLLGSWIVQTFISSAKSYIMNIVDKKTNIADNKPELFADDEIGGDNPPIKKDEK